MVSADYISREEAYRELERFSGYLDDDMIYRIKLGLSRIPAADVIEVVRCKDCKYSEHWYRDKRLCRLWYGEEKPSALIDVFDDGFCNYGERRETMTDYISREAAEKVFSQSLLFSARPSLFAHQVITDV